MRQAGHGHFNRLRAHQERDEPVNCETVHAHHRFGAGRQKSVGDQFQHLVGAIAEHQLVSTDLQNLGKFSSEVPTTAVRVEVDLPQRRRRGRERLRRGAERVLVRGQLVNPSGIKPEFPGHLGDRLARLIDRLIQDVGLGKTRGVHGLLEKWAPCLCHRAGRCNARGCAPTGWVCDWNLA